MGRRELLKKIYDKAVIFDLLRSTKKQNVLTNEGRRAQDDSLPCYTGLSINN